MPSTDENPDLAAAVAMLRGAFGDDCLDTMSLTDENPDLAAAIATLSGQPGDDRRDTVGAADLSLAGRLKAFGTSLLVHAGVAVVCSAIYFTVESPPELPVLTSIIQELDDTPLENTVQEIDVDYVDPDAAVRDAAKSVRETAAPQQLRERNLDPRIDHDMPLSPMVMALNDSDFAEILEGIQGDIVQSDSDVGSVDRITQEIVGRLREKKLVVAWLMDASESLRTRREQVINRFDRIYKELDELAGEHKDLLLTSVVAFGAQTVTMTKEPTADRALIQKAVREISIDETGVENVFTAVRTTALNHRTFVRRGYEVMIVVLTDECGNDFEMLADAVEQVKRHRMPVFVLGPMAPFGQHEVKVPWTDPQTQQVYQLPVERGPESVRFETPTLPAWNAGLRNISVASGFGSFGLAHLSRHSGGIYFLHRDEGDLADHIDVEAILDHAPEYVSTSEYMQLVKKNPLRQAVLTVTEASRNASWTQPTTRFLASAIQFDIRDDQETLMKISQFLNQAIEELKSVEESRDQEASPRWRAHYDLLLGRLLANRARLNNSLPLLKDMYLKPKVCQDGTTNAWELAAADGDMLRNFESKQTADTVDTAADVQLARNYLQRVETEHPGTPWYTLARLELDSSVTFEWKEAFLNPPKGEKLPWDKKPWSELSDKQKEAKKKFERFQLERKQKQAEKARTAAADEKKPVKIPKL